MPITFDRYKVKIQFIERIVGGIPVVPEGEDRARVYEAWAKGQNVPEGEISDLAENLAKEGDMPVAVAVEDVDGMQTGFRRDESGLYVEARYVKACLRESAQRLGIILAKRGSRQVLQHDLHVRAVGSETSQKLYLGVGEPTGVDTRPISVITRQGPRTALKKFEYVDGAQLEFVIMILTGGVGVEKGKDGGPLIGPEELGDMLELGGFLGLGADRSQGEGTFQVLSIEKIAGTPASKVG